MHVSGAELRSAVDRLGLPSDVMVHASMRSFGARVEGGADAILDALLAQDRTVLVPSFVETYFSAVPPEAMRPTRNGFDYSRTGLNDPGMHGIYRPNCGLIDKNMGLLPARLIARSESRRGEHPLNPFAALGRNSDGLVSGQSYKDVYYPIRALAEAGGWILLVGVALNRMTALHLAEQRAGRRLFVRWALDAMGEVAMVETGGCSEGFPNLKPYVETYVRRFSIRDSVWSAYPADATVSASARAIRQDPRLTGCPDGRCIRCRDARSGGPG